MCIMSRIELYLKKLMKKNSCVTSKIVIHLFLFGF